jgi:hypothetical protein
MINPTLLWFLLLPVMAGGLIWLLCGRNKEAAIFSGGYAVIAIVVTIIAFAVSHGVKTGDTEIWNGKVTGKDRVHGSYTRSYDCMCSTDSKGNRRCSTCYEDHYTVKWSCDTTVGSYTIDSEDSTFRSVYLTPNPRRWVDIGIGEPVSRTHGYTNYVQAVPESLFRPSGESVKKQFAGLIPAYPSNVYDFYRLNRFLTPGYNLPEAPSWNAAISELLKERGPKKQVNAIVVVAKTADPNYTYALRDAWLSGKKNDVVLVIGSAEWPKIDFVDVISWTKNELFKVQLRDAVLALGTAQQGPVLEILGRQIDTNFERRHMSEFKYLEAEIDPPGWLLGLLAFLIAASTAGTIYMANNRSFAYTPRRYGRYR